MHIGLVVYGSLDNQSGGYLYDRMLVEYLRAVGDRVEVISLPERDYLGHLGDNLSPSLSHRLGNLEVDILLQDELNHPSLFILNYSLRRKISFPIVSIVHHLRSSESHPLWVNHFYRWIESRYLNSVDGFIFNSQTTRHTVQELLLHEAPWIVAYPSGDRFEAGLTREMIIARAKRRDPLHLLFLGNLIPRKGLDQLLAALSSIPDGDWTLNVVGNLDMDPAYVNNVKQILSESDFEDRVTFSGFLEIDDLQRVISESHVLVLPSEYEGFGIAYLEGMGFGLPAIATTGGGAVEIISHGEDGFLVPPGDKNQLVYYLCQLMDDRQLLAKMSVAARQRYLKHPSWEETSATIRKFILETHQDFNPK